MKPGTLKNIGLTDVSVTGLSNVGGLVGYINNSYNTISNSYVTGSVSGTNTVGGLVGQNSPFSTISNSYATGSVTGTGNNVGGLVGSNSVRSTISNSYASGSVTSTGNYVGGLVGYNGATNTVSNAYATGSVTSTGNYVGGLVGYNGYTCTVSNAYATGSVSGTTYVGGLAGYSYYGTISNSYATGSVSGNNTVGGLVGYNSLYSTISNSYATGSVSGTTYVGGLIGYKNGGTVSSSYWDTITTGTSTGIGWGTTIGATGLTTSQMMQTANFSGWDFNNTWYLIPGNTRPFLRMEYGTNIINAHQLQLMAMNLGASYTLGVNIDMSELMNPSGMWGTQSATVLTSITTGFSPVGNDSTPFTGQFNGMGHTISNLYINRPSQDLIGLFGRNGGTISNVGLVGGSVSGNNIVGELAGRNWYGNINNSYATGEVSATTQVGCLVGLSLGTVNNSYATGNVTGTNEVGGLVGYNYWFGTMISNSYATGSVNGQNRVGGLVGWNWNYANISNSYATSNVTGTNEVGGLVGENGNSTISNSYAMGSVSGTSSVGGLVGNNPGGTVTNSYWDIITSGKSTGIGGGTLSGATGLTTAQMMTMSSFSGWDIANVGGSFAIWRIYEGNTYPLLRSFLTPLTITADNVSKTYDGATWSSTLQNVVYSIAGADTSGHLFNVTSPYGADSGRNAGSYNPDLYSDQQGYDISYANSNLTVNKAPLTITALTNTKTYDGNTTAAAIPNVSGLQGSDTVTDLSEIYENKNAGTGKTLSVATYTVNDGNSGNNYSYTFVADTTGVINPAALSITANDNSKTYDAVAYSGGNGITYGGFVNGETSSILDGSLTYGGDSQGAINAGTYDITPSGLTSGNYIISYYDGTLTVNQYPIIITAQTNTKTYDGTTSAAATPSITSGTLQGSDTANFSEAYENKNAGTNKTLTASGTVNDGNSGNNYSYTLVADTTGVINPAALSVTANDDSKTYNAVAYSGGNGVTYNGFVTGENSSVLGGSLTYGGNSQGALNAGTYDITPSGLTSDNYTISYYNGTLTVNPAPLSFTGTRVYDGTNIFNVALFGTGGTIATGIGTETIVLTGYGKVASKYSFAGLQNVDVTMLTIGDGTGLAINYTFVGGEQTARITPYWTPYLYGAAIGGAGGIAGAIGGYYLAPWLISLLPEQVPELIETPLHVPSKSPSWKVLSYLMPSPVVDTSDGITVQVLREWQIAMDGRPGSQGLIIVSISEELAQPGSVFSFALPERMANEIAAHNYPVTPTLADGSPLPPWLKYNPDSKTFTATNVPNGALPVTIMINFGRQSWNLEITT